MPAEQRSQLVCPVVLVAVPRAHEMQDVRPASPWNVPAGQASQCVAPVALVYLPGNMSRHGR